MREKIGLHCDVISGYAFKTSDWKTEGVPVIKIGNISNGSDVIIDEATQYVDEEFLLSLNERFVVSRGDILISLTGSHINQPTSMVGRTCRNLSNNTYLLNQRAGKVMPFANTEKQYLYYLLSTKAIKYDIANRAYGGANQVNVSPTDIKNIKWDFPSKVIQSTIANILSKYDELIEVNNQRIKKLEQTAEELYKEWFVRFRFHNWQNTEFENGIPRGWNVGRINDIVNIYDKKRVPLSSMVRDSMEKLYPYYGAAEMLDYVDDYIFDGKYLLLGEDGSVVTPEGYPVLQMVYGKFWVNNHAHILQGKDGFSTELLYLTFKKMNVNGVVTGSAQPKISQARFLNKHILIPEHKLLSLFNGKIQPIFDKRKSLLDANDNLIKQRDLLLPRLMSGKLEV